MHTHFLGGDDAQYNLLYGHFVHMVIPCFDAHYMLYLLDVGEELASKFKQDLIVFFVNNDLIFGSMAQMA